MSTLTHPLQLGNYETRNAYCCILTYPLPLPWRKGEVTSSTAVFSLHLPVPICSWLGDMFWGRATLRSYLVGSSVCNFSAVHTQHFYCFSSSCYMPEISYYISMYLNGESCCNVYFVHGIFISAMRCRGHANLFLYITRPSVIGGRRKLLLNLPPFYIWSVDCN